MGYVMSSVNCRLWKSAKCSRSGSSIAIKTAMMAMTTSSSIKVKPGRRLINASTFTVRRICSRTAHGFSALMTGCVKSVFVACRETLFSAKRRCWQGSGLSQLQADSFGFVKYRYGIIGKCQHFDGEFRDTDVFGDGREVFITAAAINEPGAAGFSTQDRADELE